MSIILSFPVLVEKKSGHKYCDDSLVKKIPIKIFVSMFMLLTFLMGCAESEKRNVIENDVQNQTGSTTASTYSGAIHPPGVVLKTILIFLKPVRILFIM